MSFEEAKERASIVCDRPRVAVRSLERIDDRALHPEIAMELSKELDREDEALLFIAKPFVEGTHVLCIEDPRRALRSRRMWRGRLGDGRFLECARQVIDFIGALSPLLW
jgi:hypothetical protein